MEIRAIRYSRTVFEEDELSSLTEVRGLLSDEIVLWVDVADPERREDLEPLERLLGLHPLALDDCMNVRQRPKVEDYENSLFVVARGVDLDPEVGRFVEGLQVGILLGKGFVVTVHKTPIPLEKIRGDMRKRRPPPELGGVLPPLHRLGHRGRRH
ncbi:MAG: CorA family divalent cation transporter [Candidatus Bathyarchaeia archaeon]